MSYHRDPEVNQAIIRLLDALCMWERHCGRRSTLLLIPHEPDEPLFIAQDGKPLPSDQINAALADQIYVAAFRERKAKLMSGI
jgi:hypothetical protein